MILAANVTWTNY